MVIKFLCLFTLQFSTSVPRYLNESTITATLVTFIDVMLETGDGLECRKDKNGEYDFETALSLTGFGKFQWTLLFVSGMTYCAFNYQGIVSSHFGPAAKCDLKMTAKDQGLLNAMFVAGGVSTAMIWGIIADQYGRRKILIVALLGDAFVTATSSLSQSFAVLLAFRFFNGLLMVAPGSIILTYMVESVGVKYRSSCMVILGSFCTLAFVFLPVLSFAVLPMEWKFVWNDFVYNSWRILVLLSSIPSFLSGIFILLFGYESPKFLYIQGNTDKAIEVMRKMYYVNYGDSKGPYPVIIIFNDAPVEARKSIILDPDDIRKLQKSNGKSLEVIFKGIAKQAKEILSPPFISASVLANTLMFTCIFGYYGLALWFPEIFNRFDLHSKISNNSATFCELTKNLTVSLSDDMPCFENKIDISVYFNTFIIGLVTVIGNILFAFLEKWCGCKCLTIVTLFVSALCATAVYFLKTATDVLIAASIFLAFVEASTMVIQSASSNMFPTRIRGLAMCLAWLSGRIGLIASSLIVGSFIDTWCELPNLLIAALLFLGALLGFFLPSPKKHVNHL